ncbi:EscU/YscU/HrcU family type III secretion system export apparatus switch protein [bacterium]|nr:EscU/YscU/HrcU family type III secretion system export apparatus switch protein [bacterium]
MPDKSKRKKAAAIKYEPKTQAAPRLIGKGRGFVAEKIIQIAKKHDIPIREDPDLAEALMALDLDESIPPELYRAVAEILAFVYQLNSKLKLSQTPM